MRNTLPVRERTGRVFHIRPPCGGNGGQIARATGGRADCRNYRGRADCPRCILLQLGTGGRTLRQTLRRVLPFAALSLVLCGLLWFLYAKGRSIPLRCDDEAYQAYLTEAEAAWEE